ncbi:MAG TPA: HipA domain-containing protein, partial [Terrimesophilobacter sp.]|nr:HipA domain-containing protein [Terrimesophilobacter sp.]
AMASAARGFIGRQVVLGIRPQALRLGGSERAGEDGVVLARLHTRGGPLKFSLRWHHAQPLFYRDICQDRTNEVLIFTGTDDQFMMEADIADFAGLPALVIERYDRADGGRIHQEDLSQALGASGNEKYQEFGGIVSSRRVAEVLQRHAPPDDLHRLARMFVFAVALGNLDFHTKNISLLHSEDGDVRLAPAYDNVPLLHQQTDGRLALSVNGKYRHAEITRGDLAAEFAGWGLRGAREIIDETLITMWAAVQHETPVDGAHSLLQESIAGTIDGLIADQLP